MDEALKGHVDELLGLHTPCVCGDVIGDHGSRAWDTSCAKCGCDRFEFDADDFSSVDDG